MAKGPVLIEIEESDAPSVADAAPVPDLAIPSGQAMQGVAQIATRPPSRLARWFFGLLGSVLIAVLSAAAWDWVMAWITRQPILGAVFAGLLGALILVALLITGKELLALRRLSQIDALRHDATRAREVSDLSRARTVARQVKGLYGGRADMKWARARFDELAPDQLDAQSLLGLAERELLTTLDAQAEAEIRAAARQVATVTALVPLALADVFAALAANMRMIRRIGEIYGGRAGTLGAWRLMRAVLGHLVATGAVAAGDELLEPILGGSVLSKLSRRFGEGLVNGALTARVGVAAMDVCRPLPFAEVERPKARVLVKGALTGLFSRAA